MANSTRQRVWSRVVSLIDGIAAGQELSGYTYETTPVIRGDMAAAFDASDEVAVWVDYGPELFDNEEFQLGAGGHKVALQIDVNILVRKRAGTTLLTEANNALQDIRNILNFSPSTWETATGASFVGFEECTTDEGTLSFDGMVLFTQPVVFMYSAGPTW